MPCYGPPQTKHAQPKVHIAKLSCNRREASSSKPFVDSCFVRGPSRLVGRGLQGLRAKDVADPLQTPSQAAIFRIVPMSRYVFWDNAAKHAGGRILSIRGCVAWDMVKIFKQGYSSLAQGHVQAYV